MIKLRHFPGLLTFSFLLLCGLTQSAAGQQPSDGGRSQGVGLSLDGLGDSLGEDTRQSQPSWKNNLRCTLDLSDRLLYTDPTGYFSNVAFIGIDLHKVFSGPEGDWGTLILQPFLTRTDNLQRRPGFFDDAHDWEFVYRICNFNFTKYGRGKFNIRLGHMEVPYGLEQVINTNGTLRDYIHGRNIGVKGDWGVSINGETKAVEYEFALLRGSGNEWRQTGDPYLVAGRIGTSRGEPVAVGVSALYGDVYRFGAPTIHRGRFGLDVITGTGPFTLMAELSLGSDPNGDVVNSVTELDWNSNDDTWLVYNQVLGFNIDLPTGTETQIVNVLGVRWAADSHWAISGQWSQDVAAFSGRPKVGVFAFQTRYRF